MSDFLQYINTGYKSICENVYIFDTIATQSLVNTNASEQYKIINCYYKAVNLKKEKKLISDTIYAFNECVEYIENITDNNFKQRFNNILYECYINLALLNTQANDTCKELLKKYYKLANNIFPERSEPYFYYGIYCNKIEHYEDAYDNLIISKNKSHNDIKILHPTSQYTAYGLYTNTELIHCCFKLKRFDETISYITEIINHPDFRNSQQQLLSLIQNINQSKMNERSMYVLD
uniref:Tetratricopeptide repeat protein n=1 Tax=viral metagenome TaxID=1070528 RepID=A0A6C0ISV7_9ZZZZ